MCCVQEERLYTQGVMHRTSELLIYVLHNRREYETTIRGLKFDLRLYVLVAGLDPPEVYLSTSGMVRFCTIPYQPPSVKYFHKTFMHLTNYSLNKRSKDYVHSEEEEGGGEEGSKRTLTSVWAELTAQGYDMDEMWGKVGKLVGQTVVVVLHYT